MIDVLDEARRAEGLIAVEDLVADAAVLRQPLFGEREPQPRDLVGRNADLPLVAGHLMLDAHRLQLLDDPCRVVGVEVVEQEREL